jgi:diadenosine tetraphosphate (Ap4A) HIT family hydrolase
MNTPCPLCSPPASADVIASTPNFRVVWANELHYPCFVRVIWVWHVAEMSDLSTAQQSELMQALMAIERAMRAVLSPDKINLASFGNRVPHVHWHVIPRWTDDTHWPEPTWAAAQRSGAVHGESLKSALAQAIVQQLSQGA